MELTLACFFHIARCFLHIDDTQISICMCTNLCSLRGIVDVNAKLDNLVHFMEILAVDV